MAVLADDGIGKEVMPYALDALNIVAAMDGSIRFDFSKFDLGSEYLFESWEDDVQKRDDDTCRL